MALGVSGLQSRQALFDSMPDGTFAFVAGVAPGGNFIASPEAALAQACDGVHAAHRDTRRHHFGSFLYFFGASSYYFYSVLLV
jgi:hypothetical protein